MPRAFDASHQAYSSTLAAYTLKQFSAARAALDTDEVAAAKLPAIHAYDYRTPKPSAEASPESTSPKSPTLRPASDNEIDENKDR